MIKDVFFGIVDGGVIHNISTPKVAIGGSTEQRFYDRKSLLSTTRLLISVEESTILRLLKKQILLSHECSWIRCVLVDSAPLSL